MPAPPLHQGPLPALDIELLDGTEQVAPVLNVENDQKIRTIPVLSQDDLRLNDAIASSYEDVPPGVFERFAAAASNGSGEDAQNIWAQAYRGSWRSAFETWKRFLPF